MKKLITIALGLCLQVNVWALGGYGSLSGDEKMVAETIKNTLAVSEADAFALFDGYIKNYLDTDDWQYNSFNNETLTASKVEQSKNKTLYLNFVTDNRFINVSLIKFAAEKHVQIHALETLPRTAQIATDKHESLKADKEFTLDTDKPQFSVFTRKGYSDRVKVLVNSGVGGIQYVDFMSYDLKQ